MKRRDPSRVSHRARRSQVRLGDFGFARRVAPHEDGRLALGVGTPGYMAPEVEATIAAATGADAERSAPSAARAAAAAVAAVAGGDGAGGPPTRGAEAGGAEEASAASAAAPVTGPVVGVGYGFTCDVWSLGVTLVFAMATSSSASAPASASASTSMSKEPISMPISRPVAGLGDAVGVRNDDTDTGDGDGDNDPGGDGDDVGEASASLPSQVDSSVLRNPSPSAARARELALIAQLPASSSALARHAVAAALTTSARSRPSAAALLKHGWFCGDSPVGT